MTMLVITGPQTTVSNVSFLLCAQFSKTWWDFKDQILGFDSRQGLGIFIHHCVRTGSGVHSASYPVDTGGSFPGGKAFGAWSFTSTPQHIFMM